MAKDLVDMLLDRTLPWLPLPTPDPKYPNHFVYPDGSGIAPAMQAGKWVAHWANRTPLRSDNDVVSYFDTPEDAAQALYEGNEGPAAPHSAKPGYTPAAFPPELEHRKQYAVRSDMGEETLVLLVEDDGDVIVSVVNPKAYNSAQFCTLAGGGKSPRVRDALLALADAIRITREESRPHAVLTPEHRVPPLDSVPPAHELAVQPLENPTEEEAHRQGEWAFTFGMEQDRCPYPAGSIACAKWLEGWKFTQENDEG
jgi:hypothetical protein